MVHDIHTLASLQNEALMFVSMRLAYMAAVCTERTWDSSIHNSASKKQVTFDNKPNRRRIRPFFVLLHYYSLKAHAKEMANKKVNNFVAKPRPNILCLSIRPLLLNGKKMFFFIWNLSVCWRRLTREWKKIRKLVTSYTLQIFSFPVRYWLGCAVLKDKISIYIHLFA